MQSPYSLPNEDELLRQAREYAAHVAEVDAMVGDMHETVQALDRAGTPDAMVAPLRGLAAEGSRLINGNATIAQLADFAARCKVVTAVLERALGIPPLEDA